MLLEPATGGSAQRAVFAKSLNSELLAFNPMHAGVVIISVSVAKGQSLHE